MKLPFLLASTPVLLPVPTRRDLDRPLRPTRRVCYDVFNALAALWIAPCEARVFTPESTARVGGFAKLYKRLYYPQEWTTYDHVLWVGWRSS